MFNREAELSPGFVAHRNFMVNQGFSTSVAELNWQCSFYSDLRALTVHCVSNGLDILALHFV
jgi:hypothetical protein